MELEKYQQEIRDFPDLYGKADPEIQERFFQSLSDKSTDGKGYQPDAGKTATVYQGHRGNGRIQRPALFQQDIPILHGNVPFRLYGRHGGRLSSPELLWSTPVFFFKQLIKIVHVLKAGGRSRLGDREGGVFEQHGRMLQLQLQDDRDKRLSRIFFQQAAQVIGRKMKRICGFLQSQIHIIAVDIVQDTDHRGGSCPGTGRPGVLTVPFPCKE